MATFHRCLRLLLRTEGQEHGIPTWGGKRKLAKEGTGHREAESLVGVRRGRKQTGRRKRADEGMERNRFRTFQRERQNL